MEQVGDVVAETAVAVDIRASKRAVDVGPRLVVSAFEVEDDTSVEVAGRDVERPLIPAFTAHGMACAVATDTLGREGADGIAASLSCGFGFNAPVVGQGERAPLCGYGGRGEHGAAVA